MEETLCGLYRQVIDHCGDAVLFADREGIIRLWNDSAVRIFGFGRDEAIGRNLDLIVPEKLRPRHWEGYHRAMASGTSKYSHDLLSVPALHKEGKKLSVEFTVVLVRNGSGEVEGVAAVVRDATTRWEKERSLLARVTVLEGTQRS